MVSKCSLIIITCHEHINVDLMSLCYYHIMDLWCWFKGLTPSANCLKVMLVHLNCYSTVLHYNVILFTLHPFNVNLNCCPGSHIKSLCLILNKQCELQTTSNSCFVPGLHYGLTMMLCTVVCNKYCKLILCQQRPVYSSCSYLAECW